MTIRTENGITFETLTYVEWVEKFKPTNEGGYETFGVDFKYIQSLDPRYVWTLRDAGFGNYMDAGIKYVNRILYFVTENPWVYEHTYTECETDENETEQD